MSFAEHQKQYCRAHFHDKLYQLCVFLDINIIDLKIDWIDYDNNNFWDSINDITIVYINNFDKTVNCRANSIKASAQAVINAI